MIHAVTVSNFKPGHSLNILNEKGHVPFTASSEINIHVLGRCSYYSIPMYGICDDDKLKQVIII